MYVYALSTVHVAYTTYLCTVFLIVDSKQV